MGCGSAAAESFMATNEQYLSQDLYRQKDDGCTAVAAVLIGNKLTVANVGDSRAVLSRNKQGVPPLPKSAHFRT